MRSSLVLALALVLAPPDVGPEAAAPAAAGTRAGLEEKITLRLQKADLSQVLERIATLLGKTLILEPGVGGTVTLEARETPVSDVLAGLQASHALSVRLEGDRMYVSKAGADLRPGRRDEESSNLAYLADESLPRRPAADKPKRFDGAIEFLEEGTGAAAAWQIGGSLATVTLPGCAGPVAVSLLSGDAFDGIPRVVFAPADGTAARARIAAPGATVRLAGCAAPLALRALDSREGVPKSVPVPLAGTFALSLRVLEAGPDGDDVLAAPRIALAAGEAGTLQTGSQKAAPSGTLLGQTIRMSAAVLSAKDADALVACSVSVTRDVEPGPGQAPLTIRIARSDESLRLSYGKPARITVSPTYGRGRSALVLEVTVDRKPGKG